MASTSRWMADVPSASEFDLREWLPAAPERILILQTAFIGDVVLALPVAQTLKLWYPQSSISFLLRDGNQILTTGHPAVDETLVWDKSRGKLPHLFQMIRHLRRQQFDLIINLHRFVSSGLMTALSGAGMSIGFDKNPISWAYDVRRPHRIAHPGEPPLHEVDRNLSLLTHDTEAIPTRRPRLYPSESDYSTVRARSQAQPYVVLAPATVWPAKQWPEEKWRKLIKSLAGTYSMYVVGAPAMQRWASVCSRASTTVRIVLASSPCSKRAALMNDAERVITNDSGPMHFASAMNAPTTAIFTATHPSFGFGPLSDVQAVVEPPPEADERPPELHAFRHLSPKLERSRQSISVDKVLRASGLA